MVLGLRKTWQVLIQIKSLNSAQQSTTGSTNISELYHPCKQYFQDVKQTFFRNNVCAVIVNGTSFFYALIHFHYLYQILSVLSFAIYLIFDVIFECMCGVHCVQICVLTLPCVGLWRAQKWCQAFSSWTLHCILFRQKSLPEPQTGSSG